MHVEDVLFTILKGDSNEVAGAAFAVRDNLLITCAHVMNVAIGRSKDATVRPNGTETIRIQGLNRRPFDARLDASDDAWSAPRPGRPGADLCLLRISPDPFPALAPTEFERTLDLLQQPFRAAGFPADWRGDMDVAEGRIIGKGEDVYQLRTAQVAKGGGGLFRRLWWRERRPAGVIHSGFSGSPVEVGGKIAGMIAQARAEISDATAYMIPATAFPERLFRRHPVFGPFPLNSEVRERLRRATSLNRLCDRVTHTTDFTDKSMILPPESFGRPHVFVLTGGFLDAHSLLVERLHEKEIRQLASARGCRICPEIIKTDPFDSRDIDRYQRCLARDLFQKLGCEQPSFHHPSALPLVEAKKGERCYWVIQHDFEAVEFQGELAKLFRWYIDIFWGSVKFDVSRFFVFLNVIYPQGDLRNSPLRLSIGNELKEVFPEPSAEPKADAGNRTYVVRERNTGAGALGCPSWLLQELNHVELMDVQKWVDDRRIYPSREAAYQWGEVIYGQAPRDAEGWVRMDGVSGCLEAFRLKISAGEVYP